MHIACSINKDYIPHMCAMLLSAFTHTTVNKIDIHVLHADLDLENQMTIRNEFMKYNQIAFHFYEVNKSIFKDVPIIAKHLRVETLYRLTLASIIPAEISKILYIDSDIIIKDDLIHIWNEDITEYHVGAVVNLEGEMYQILGLGTPLNYFNAGFILINLEKWRKELLFDRFMEYVSTNLEKIVFADQDILNGVLDGNWKRFHPKWNVQNSIYYTKEWFIEYLGENTYINTINSPSIIHFSGPTKPWELVSIHVLTNEYYQYANQLSWEKKFPYGKKDNMNKGVYVFGTGTFSLAVTETLKYFDIPIIGYLDNDHKQWGKHFKGVQIYSPDEILLDQAIEVEIIIASSYYNDIVDGLNKKYSNKSSFNIT